MKRKPPEERLWLHISPEPNSGCWLWLGVVGKGGYGKLSKVGGHGTILAHRASWAIYKGAIPDGMHVLHKCDIPSCVNPDHLFLGSHADNMADMVRKNRSLSGKQRFAFCKRGHDLNDPVNILLNSADGRKRCRICQNLSQKRRYHRLTNIHPRR